MTLQIESLRELLKSNGFDEEKIAIEVKRYLAIENEKKMKEKEESEKIKTSEEAAVYLGQHLKGKWDSQKVRRLMREGKLEPTERSEKRVQKRGHRFHIDKLDEYIRRAKRTREELENENDKLKERIKELEEKLNAAMVAEKLVVPAEISEGQLTLDEILEVQTPMEPKGKAEKAASGSSKKTDKEKKDAKVKKNDKEPKK